METKNVKIEKEETKVKKEIKPKKVTVDVPKLNLRSEASANSNVIKVLEKSEILSADMSFKNAEWFKVETSDKTEGYVMKDFVK